MNGVFLKSDVEPTSTLAQIEAFVEVFLTIYSPTTRVDTTAQPGDDIINITEHNAHVGAGGYHINLNGVSIAYVKPSARGRLWGTYIPERWSAPIYATVFGKRIIIKPSKLTTPAVYTPGLISDICHEIAECLADGDVETYLGPDRNGFQVLYEPCDWVEGTYFARTINGITAVLPNVALRAFGDLSNKQGPYDLMGLVKAPWGYTGPTAEAWGYDPKKYLDPKTAVLTKIFPA